jgi:hypothetical protein
MINCNHEPNWKVIDKLTSRAHLRKQRLQTTVKLRVPTGVDGTFPKTAVGGEGIDSPKVPRQGEEGTICTAILHKVQPAATPADIEVAVVKSVLVADPGKEVYKW